jgi:hypothetical protein
VEHGIGLHALHLFQVNYKYFEMVFVLNENQISNLVITVFT